MMMKKGFFITLYGINNLGKSLQAYKLVKWFKEKNHKAEYLKYPVYNLAPSGYIINEQLRGEKGQTISEEKLQFWFAVNRMHYEPILISKLNSGITIVAEDYTGTGLAWGEAKNADKFYLRQINKVLLKEDLSILFRGERFKSGIEKRHVHERNFKLVEICKDVHDNLAIEFGWKPLDANQSRDRVFNDLVAIVKRELKI